MAEFTREIHINKSPDAVFAFACDLENAPNWITDIVRIEKLTEGPVRAGTQFRETRRFGNQEHSAVIEVTAHEAPRVHTASSSAFGIHCTYHYTFEPEASGTRVRLEAQATSKWYPSFVINRMLRMMENMDGDQLEKLKAAMDREAKPL